MKEKPVPVQIELQSPWALVGAASSVWSSRNEIMNERALSISESSLGTASIWRLQPGLRVDHAGSSVEFRDKSRSFHQPPKHWWI